MNVGELGGFGLDLTVRVCDLRSNAANGGLERGNGRSDERERRFSVAERGELREEVMVARENLRAKLLLEMADAFLELLGGGSGGAGGERLGGEAGGGEVRREEERENGVSGEGSQRIGIRRRSWVDNGCGGISVFEGGEFLERRRRRRSGWKG